ncbi:polymerase protein [avian paramyxovirus 15]|uniref:RNA-directed RNA polymerase L n=2 Tax=avian paramyxovirus 15 TaxID=1983777 RepID=A0A1W6R4T1_9MONO|nr:polymerase protein [Avian paramyxovirus 15]ARO49358.2 polymerase protein [Avian paramyxovirus 15]
MDQRQSDNIIHPEVHLDSPLVKNKLALLWKLLGLPLPKDLQDIELINLTTEADFLRQEQTIKDKLLALRDLSTKHLKRHGLLWNHIEPVCHPRTLSWLLKLECSKAQHLRAKREQVINQSFKEHGTNIQHLFTSLSHKLISNSGLFSSGDQPQESPLPAISSGAKTLITSYRAAVNTEWSEGRWCWLHVKQVMRYLMYQSRIHKHSTNIKVWSEKSNIIGVTPDVVVVINVLRKIYTVLTFEMVLMYSDTAEGRDNAIVVGRLSPFLQLVVDKLGILFELIDSLAIEIGEKIYDVIATLESMAYASVQLHDASIVQAGEFLSFNLSELVETLNSLIDPAQAKRIIEIIRLCYTGLSVDQSAELLCLMRLFGHPLLSAKDAAKKVRESMCSPKVVEFDTILQTLSFFKGILINGYRRAHSGIWPNIDPDTILDEDIRQLYLESSEIPHSIMLRKYQALSLLEFKKSIDFDLSADLSAYLKDKAICRPKPQWSAIFRKSLVGKSRQMNNSTDIRSNRLLIDFLESDDFDPYQEFNYVVSMDYLKDPDFCASYSLKEKEIKTTGRIFAKMTRKMRSCQVLLESLLSKHICKFFKENGVSMEQLSLTKSLLSMSQLAPRISTLGLRPIRNNRTRPKYDEKNESSANFSGDPRGALVRDKTVVATFLTTDLQKYCLNWRYSSIKLFAQALNQLFGLDHGFEWIHLRLMDSTMFVGDPYSPPESALYTDLDDAPNDDIFIVSARGGIEGLCQKLWTMISISIIHCVAEKIGARVAAMVQGDNQVIAITRELYSGDSAESLLDELDHLSDQYFAEFKRHNYGIGHNLKLKETIRSHSFFVYSKRVFWEGRILSQILKNATKLCYIADHVGENSVSSCSNLSSTIARLVENGYEKDTAFILNQSYLMNQLMIDEQYTLTCDYSEARRLIGTDNYRNLFYATLIPGQVGGYNFLNISRLFTRNIGDPVTSAISDIKWYIKSNLLPRRVLKNLILREPGDGGWATLCADPYALNIQYTQLPTTYLKKHTQRTLLASASNPLLSGVQIPSQHIEEELLAQFLLDREAVMPRVAHVIMESSILGRRKQIQGLIDTTPTIIKTALMHHPVSRRKTEKIVNYSIDYLTACHDFIIAQIEFPTSKEEMWENNFVDEDTCSVIIAEFLRAVSWRNLLNGRIIQGVTSPDTIELITGSLIGENSYCRLCASGDNNYTWMFLPGPTNITSPYVSSSKIRVPYLGSKTEERRTASMATVKGMSHHLKAALRGASVYIWAFGDTEQNWEDALKIVSTRCNISINQLKLLTPTPSSSNIQHRLADGISVQKFTPAGLSRVSSFVHICNDAQKLEKDDGQVDSNLIYQQIMLTGLAVFETIHPMNIEWVSYNQTLHLHTGLSCCTREVEGSLVNPPSHELGEITITQQNKFLFDSEPIPEIENIKIALKEFKVMEINLDGLSGYDSIKLLSKCTARLICECINEEGVSSSVKNDAVISFDNTINWISETLMCDIHYLVTCIGQEILTQLAYQIYYLRIRGLNSILAYIESTLERIPVIQLANFALTISHHEIWRRLELTGLRCNARVAYLANVDFIGASRDVILYGCRLYLQGLLIQEEPSYLFFDVCDGDLNAKMEQFLARRLCIIVSLIGTTLNYPIIRQESPIQKCVTLSDFIETISVSDARCAATARVLQTVALSPSIDTVPTNLYYTTRRVLSNIRSSEISRAQITYLYNEDIPTHYDELGIDPVTTDDPIIQRGLFFNVELTADKLSTHVLPSVCGLLNDTSVPLNMEYDKPGFLITQLTKSVGTSSTSWYKFAVWYATRMRQSVILGDSMYVGEGSGCVMTLFEYLDPSNNIFYNSLFSSDMNPPQRNYGLSPYQFERSIVYKNILAGASSKYGFTQEFHKLWREIDAETNISEPAFMNYALEVIKPHSCKRIVCDAEFDSGMPEERIIQAYTHIILLSSYALTKHGLILLKLHCTSERITQFVFSSLLMIFGRVQIHRNGYMNLNNQEILVSATLGEVINYVSIPPILTRIKALFDSGLTIIHPDNLRRIRTQEESLRIKLQQLERNVLSKAVKLQLCKTDILLLHLGGSLIQPGQINIQELREKSAGELQKEIIELIDTAISEINVIKNEAVDLDIALMMSPYNINKSRKIATIARICTRRVIPIWLIMSIQLNSSSLASVCAVLERGVISWETCMTSREYISCSTRPRFIKKIIGASTVERLFKTCLL